MSAFIDGSQIYGANRREADLLRDRTANLGLLRVASFPLSSAKSPLLPKAEAQTFCRSHNPTKKPCFLAGDHARVNENPGNVNFLLNELIAFLVGGHWYYTFYEVCSYFLLH